MRIEIREGSSKGVVTRSSTVAPDAKNKAQLECQRSLWKPGDVLLTLDGAKGSIIVRDWGLVGGVCRHQDTKASVVLIGEDEDDVIFSVTRGKTTVKQDWARVR